MARIPTRIRAALLVLCLIALAEAPAAHAQTIGRFTRGVLTIFKRDSTFRYDFDSLAYRTSQLQRLLDSTAKMVANYRTYISGSRGVIIDSSTAGLYRLDVPSLGELQWFNQVTWTHGTNDSINFPLGVGTYQTIFTPYDLYPYAFSFALSPGAGGVKTGTTGTPFDYRPVMFQSSDSVYFVRIVRNNAQPLGAYHHIGVWKVPMTSWGNPANTAGTCVTLEPMDDSKFPAAGTATLIYLQVIFAKKRL